MSELIGFVSWPCYRSFSAASLPLSSPLEICSTVSNHVVCAECHLTLRGAPLTDAKAWALISIWIRFPKQGNFTSCQHSPAHRFQFLKWSIILFYLFAASLPAATVECDHVVVVFCLWLQCNLHNVLKVCFFRLSNLFIAGVLVILSVSFLIWFNGCEILIT